MTEKKKHIYGLNDLLKFGKHRGQSIQSVLDRHSDYLLWAIEHVDSFAMTDEAWDYAISINAKFSLLQPKPKAARSAETVESIDADGVEVLSHYPWRDGEAARAKYMSYARNVAEEVAFVANNISPIQLTLF